MEHIFQNLRKKAVGQETIDLLNQYYEANQTSTASVTTAATPENIVSAIPSGKQTGWDWIKSFNALSGGPNS